MDIKEIRIKSVGELTHLLEELRKKLDDLLFKVNQKQLKNIRELRTVRKDIAKTLLVLREKRDRQTKN